MRLLGLVVAVLCSVLTGAPSVHAQTTPDFGRYVALVIGNALQDESEPVQVAACKGANDGALNGVVDKPRPRLDVPSRPLLDKGLRERRRYDRESDQHANADQNVLANARSRRFDGIGHRTVLHGRLSKTALLMRPTRE